MENRLKILLIAGMMLTLLPVSEIEANDVQLSVPESSLQSAMDALVHARFFSYGSTSSSNVVNYYGYLPETATVNVLPNKKFKLTLTGRAIANFQLLMFSFDLPGLSNQKITIDGDIKLMNESSGYRLVLSPTGLTDETGNWLSGIINLATLLVKITGN